MYSNRKKLKIQGKTSAHRKALIKSQITELLRNGRVKTTPKKARAVSAEFDRLVRNFKKNTGGNYAIVKKQLNNKRLFERLEKVVEEKLSDRDSGYTRRIKTLPRPGDNAEQVYLMLVNFEPKKKESRLSKITKKQEDKKSSSITGRVSRAVKEAAGGRKTEAKGVDNNTKTRRVST